MEKLLLNFIIVMVIAIISVGISIFWRTCIYSRGGIFRFFGRLLDKFVDDGCMPTSHIGHKILRFIAYPLGRCIYCSSFHFGYYTFFILSYSFKLELDMIWLVVMLPIQHLMVIYAMKLLITGNPDMDKDDWLYIRKNQIFDFKTRCKTKDCILSKEEEKCLDRAKG